MGMMKLQGLETLTEAFIVRDLYTIQDSLSTNLFGDPKGGFLNVL
jgi:hypothetical protein